MPDGAQAWKMIKAPGSQSGRIAQACDRCRSKKIKCDGKRPNCSQCMTVGFACKITDKLTRRAFPRGYTESLEERIRLLESENAKIVKLLDLKDEQIELLSKVDDLRRPSHYPTTTTSNTKNDNNSNTSGTNFDDDEEPYITTQVTRLSLDGLYTGASAGGIFVDVLIDKLAAKAPASTGLISQMWKCLENDSCSSCSDERNTPHAAPQESKSNYPVTPPLSITSPPNTTNPYLFSLLNVGSRLSCDQFVNAYFQEWHSVFEVLEQEDFLATYEKFVDLDTISTGNIVPDHNIYTVTFVLVLALGSIASKISCVEETRKLENEWKSLFTSSLASVPSIKTIQALCLAQLYSLYTGNVADVWRYRSLSISMAQRIGLYKCQKALYKVTGESFSSKEELLRNKLFWSVYVLDCFSSIVLGSPRLINDKHIGCVIPENKDNSASFSIIQLTRILSGIMDTFYLSCDVNHSYKTIITYEDQLEKWKRELDDSLKFEFGNGAPKTNLKPVHQKSPLLTMLYHYARILIHLPIATSTGASSTKSSGSTIAVTQSAKTYMQLFDYLLQRKVVITLCINPSKMLIYLGSILFYSAIDYSRGGALLQDTKALMSSALNYLYKEIQAGSPARINQECYFAFHEVCEIILGNHDYKKDSKSKPKPKPRKIKKNSGVKSEPDLSNSSNSSVSSDGYILDTPVTTKDELTPLDTVDKFDDILKTLDDSLLVDVGSQSIEMEEDYMDFLQSFGLFETPLH